LIDFDTAVYVELWVSLASMLRSYTAVHGLNRREQAVVELGEEHILVRAGERWLKLDRNEAEVSWSRENGIQGTMLLTVDGRLKSFDGVEEELDMQAEAWARELMQ
jgi:hypothetical protein